MGEKHAFMNDVIETGRREMPLSEKMAFTVIDENSMQAQFSSNKTAALQKTGEQNAHNAPLENIYLSSVTPNDTNI